MSDSPGYEFWREYPDHDPQAVVWYPLTYGPLDVNTVWPLAGPEPKHETSLYIHIPFCAVICPFCPFNKFASVEKMMSEFVIAVKREIELLASRSYWSNAHISAAFFGGGTPTALSGERLADIIETCRKLLRFSDDTELTVEGSPETLTPEKLKMLRDVGVNRISFGVQSFDDHYLKMLGRGHNAATARKTIDMVADAGFDNVAIDLMYRLPGQTLEEVEKDLDTALRSGVSHISAYSLFVEPGSPLARVQHRGKLLPLPDEQTDLEMFRLVIDRLAQSNFELYTLYDFAPPGKRCEHHVINWHAPQKEYVGIGPGAFSFVRNGRDEFVYGNVNPLERYFDLLREGKLPIDFGVHLSEEEQMARYMVLGTNGLDIPKAPFEQRFGQSIHSVFGETVDKLQGWGLVEDLPGSVSLTRKGRLYLANVGKSFCTERNRMKPHPAGVDLQKGAGQSLIGINK
ncbi:radical SAM family heme chaperone HemW [Myxococcus stipitatus]|uniref:radical SAM family heme chaperone HemW n=1 Tax=Myxococcus stipitatus TaxID=83455 RepID=UPI00314544D7